MNSPVEDTVIVIVKAMVVAEVEELAALITTVPHQAIKVLLRML